MECCNLFNMKCNQLQGYTTISMNILTLFPLFMHYIGGVQAGGCKKVGFIVRRNRKRFALMGLIGPLKRTFALMGLIYPWLQSRTPVKNVKNLSCQQQQFDGKTVDMELDIRASLTIIPTSIWTDALASKPVEHTGVTPRRYYGNDIPVIREAKVQVEYHNHMKFMSLEKLRFEQCHDQEVE